MSVKIFSGKESERVVELPDGSTYFDLLESLKMNPETVVILKDGIPVAFDAPAGPEKLEVLRVVSGG
jgi:sulfur carrier protein